MKNKLRSSVALLFVVLWMVSCSEKQRIEEPKNSKPSTHDLLQGRWGAEDSNGNWQLYLSVEEDYINGSFPLGNYESYLIEDDTLFVYYEKHLQMRSRSFVISSLDSVCLELIPIKKVEDFPYNEYIEDTLILKKIKKQNSEVFKSLTFLSSRCFGTCPVIYLEIDSVGNVLYDGLMYVENEGAYIGKLKNSELKVMENLISEIDFTNYEKWYDTPNVDGAIYMLKIVTNKNDYTYRLVGSKKEPLQLLVMVGKLIDLDKFIKLNKVADSTVREFLLRGSELYRSHILLPPPPPVITGAP